MSLVLIIIAVLVFLGLPLLGAGGYALYQVFTHNEAEQDQIWLGSRSTLLIIGIIATLGGLGLICGPVAFFLFGVALPMG